MKLEDYFFVIDSDHPENVSSRLYGFCLNEEGMIRAEDGVVPDVGKLTGNGSYVLILADGDRITVLQDAIGSQGLYLYRDGGYFALGNSDLYLMEYLKAGGVHPFTTDRDYAAHLVPRSTGVHACSETIVNEIRLLPRNAVVIMEKDASGKNTLRIEYRDLEEDLIPVDTEEGVALLDRWMDRWTGVIRSVYAENGNLEFDLSGGFDSRMSVLTALNAGVDLNGVMMRSLTDGLSCHDEDLRIASMIAEAYGFRLNDDSCYDLRDRPLSIPEILSISMYTKGLSHKQMYYKTAYHGRPKFRVTGAGGENRRQDKKNRQPDEILADCLKEEKKYFSKPMQAAAEEAERRLLNRAEAEIRAALEGREDIGEVIARRLWMDSRWRYHFGKDMYECFLANEIKLLPLLDPELMKLKRGGARGDDDLLMALMFVRYGKSMLDIPFEGGRSIAAETIAYAEELCGRFPRKQPEGRPFLRFERTDPEAAESTGPAQRPAEQAGYSEEQAWHYARLLGADPRFRDRFSAFFDEETYLILTGDSFIRKFRPLQMVNAVIAVGLTELYAEESVSGSPETFAEIVEKLPVDGYVDLTVELLREAAARRKELDRAKKESGELREKLAAAEKELEAAAKNNAALEAELEKIRGSRSYRLGEGLARPYRKLFKK